jgi:hypothetical protein
VNTGVFTLKNAIPATNEQITKADADYYVNINTSYAPYAAKASNQLVVKSDLQAAAVVSYPFTIWYDQPCYWDGFFVEGGAPTDSDACALNTNSIVLYGNSPTLANGMSLYYDSALINRWYGNQGGCGNFYRYGTETFMYLDVLSTVQSLTACCAAQLNISAMFLGPTDMQILFLLSTAQPTDIIISFDWCTDSGASGYAWSLIAAGNLGPMYGITIDLTRTGFTSSGTTWGSQEINVIDSSNVPVNGFFICGTSIGITGLSVSCVSYDNGC